MSVTTSIGRPRSASVCQAETSPWISPSTSPYREASARHFRRARGLARVARCLFASPRYLRARGTPERVDDLAQHDLIAFRAIDGFTTWSLTHERSKRRHTFAPRLYTSEISVAQRAAVAGLGIALFPESLCEHDVSKNRLVRVLDGWEGERGGVHLLYRAHRSLTAAVRTCIGHLLGVLPGTDPSRAP